MYECISYKARYMLEVKIICISVMILEREEAWK